MASLDSAKERLAKELFWRGRGGEAGRRPFGFGRDLGSGDFL